jgi:hypothetical protein
MAAETTSGAAPGVEPTRLGRAPLSDAFADEECDAADEPIALAWREQAHRHARRHRRWLPARSETTMPGCGHEV